MPKGPRVPTSIQSTSDSIKTHGTTLMRITPHHGITEFSDLGWTESRVDGCTGLMWPSVVALASSCVSINHALEARALQGAMASILYLVLNMVTWAWPHGVPPPCTTPGTPHHPGYTQHVDAGYLTVRQHGYGL